MADPGRVGIAGEAGAVMLDALFTQSPVGLAVLDGDLRVVQVNTATPAMQGMREEDVIGRSFPGSHYVVEAEAVEALLRRVLESGDPLDGQVVRARPPAHLGQERRYELSAFRLEDPRGAVLGVAITVVDVTYRERARIRLGILDAVRERVGRTLDIVVTCQELAEALVPAFADIAVVELVDAVIRGGDPPLSPLARGVTLRRAAFRSSGGEGRPQAHLAGAAGILTAPTPYSQALADLLPRAVALDSGLPWLAADPARARAVRELGAQTLLAVPLALRGAVIGLVSLYRTRSGSPYDDEDVALALDVARHTALCIDNARRYTRDHSVAAIVLQHILPLRATSHTALEAASIARSGDGGNTWYETIALSGARVALVAGTVSGGGIHATATMGQLRTVVHSLTALDLDPEDLLARLNDTAALLVAERASLPSGNPLHREPVTASCAYAVYDPLTRICIFARADHPAPVIVHSDGTVNHPDTSPGPRLGSTDQAPFAATRIQIPDGSVMAFPAAPALASHLTAAANPLHTAPAYADRPLQELCDDILYTLPADIQADDAVLLLARTHPFPCDRVATWQLEDELTTASAARKYARDQLDAWSVEEETAFNTELIVSELVTNAIRYGSPPLELRLILDRTLTCEVSDCSATAPHLRHARTTDEGGRGLFIAAQLAQAWGARYSADGKTIWTEQTLTPA
ncbi:SpoIIE family protein phosphatase [Streptomyces sp. NBC_01320]|uniref:SpoIIE family protein phosphatase n=1 Tax=Streptomyces sp. NBC_01320 TaxID=2903824 RepID=UPI002E161692|nr:SpoIIE family protein phosphatase [Streptomyces sp. NBC_01320]